MNTDVIFNYMVDLKKKNINYFDRARIINTYLQEENMSQRQLGELINIPHATIQDWLLWLKISEEEYHKLLHKGYSDTQIYKLLRTNKKMDKDFIMKKTKLEYVLEFSIKSIEPYIKRAPKTEEVKSLLLKLRDTINRTLMYIDKR